MESKEKILERNGIWQEPENTVVNSTASYYKVLQAMTEYAAPLHARIAELETDKLEFDNFLRVFSLKNKFKKYVEKNPMLRHKIKI